jgi:regulatory protein
VPRGSGRPAGPAEKRARRAAVDDPAVVLEAALRYLEPRARATVELHRHLVRAGYRSELVDGVVMRLTELGMLDDAAFARHWVESRDRAHPRGEAALRAELRRLGVAETVVREVLVARSADLADLPSDGGAPREAVSADEAAAVRLLERRASALERFDPVTRRQRAYGLLARNGFDPDVCRRVAAAFAAPPDPSDRAGDPLDPGPATRAGRP